MNVLVHGLTYCGNMLATLLDGQGWNVEYHGERSLRDCAALARSLRSCDLAYQIGGRVSKGPFLSAAKLLRKKPLVMHWCGSDVLFARTDFWNGKEDPWILNECQHWAEVPWLAEELSALGVQTEVVPLTSLHMQATDILPLPDRFSVLVYLSNIRKTEFYGLHDIVAAAKVLPDIDFTLVGPTENELPLLPRNVRPIGWVQDMRSVYAQVSALWRPVRHDGLSFMVLEALAHGRQVLYTYEYPGCIHAYNVKVAIRELERLYSLHRQGGLMADIATSELVRTNYSPERVRNGILQRFERMVLA